MTGGDRDRDGVCLEMKYALGDLRGEREVILGWNYVIYGSCLFFFSPWVRVGLERGDCDVDGP